MLLQIYPRKGKTAVVDLAKRMRLTSGLVVRRMIPLKSLIAKG